MSDPIRDWLDDADDRPRYGAGDAFELALERGVTDPRRIASALLLVEEAARMAQRYPVSFDRLIDAILEQTVPEPSLRYHMKMALVCLRVVARDHIKHWWKRQQTRVRAVWRFLRWRT